MRSTIGLTTGRHSCAFTPLAHPRSTQHRIREPPNLRTPTSSALRFREPADSRTAPFRVPAAATASAFDQHGGCRIRTFEGIAIRFTV